MLLQLIDIHKHFGALRANDGISLEIRPGEILGILGENGAGKSTLMKIMAGFSRRTSGEIRIDGEPVDFASPADATRRGIGMLYQEPMDFPSLSVIDNFMLGQVSGISMKKKRFREKLAKLAHRFDFHLAPGATPSRLTVGERQQLELLRLLARGMEVLILDEPTTGISAVQKQKLFTALEKLADSKKSIILVSHKLADAGAICHRIVVLRQGKIAGEMKRPFDNGKILEMMFGDIPARPPAIREPPGAPVLRFSNVSAPGERSGLHDCSATIHSGEMVGLAGLEGSGQGVFLRLAAGLARPRKGAVILGDSDGAPSDYHSRQRRGIVFLPAARLEEGLIRGLTIREHFMLRERNPSFFLNPSRADALAESGIRTFRIKGSPASPVEALSGGNQQRLLLSLLPENPEILLLENPTRGLDVDSARWIWNFLGDFCRRGKTVIFTSSELDEILEVAGRILVFFEGRIQLDILAEHATPEIVSAAIAGKTVMQ